MHVRFVLGRVVLGRVAGEVKGVWNGLGVGVGGVGVWWISAFPVYS